MQLKLQLNLIFPILTLQAVTGSHRIGCWGCWTRSLKGDITTGQHFACPKIVFLNNNAKPTCCQVTWRKFFKIFFSYFFYFSLLSNSFTAEYVLNAKNFAPLELKCSISSEYNEVFPCVILYKSIYGI